MKKTTRIAGITVLVIGLILSSCVSTPPAGQSAAGLSSKTHALIQDAVFEVVIKKPTADSLRYDKPLDWGSVPYAIRTDEYYSIGTAFAISKTELVTAFHVINLGEASTVFEDYYIRDSKGKVYEVDSIVRGSNERDFLVFTIKGRTFDKFFKLEPDFTVGSQVFSVGNALGEGIIVRNGLVLGTVPEEESGRWQRLKSSADGNPGNSGGPLVTPDGKVIGVVQALKDNILYTLPVSALLEVPADSLRFRQKFTYGHLLLANTLTKVYETEVALPADYKTIRKEVTDRYKTVYEAAMKELFEAAPGYLDGPNNAYFLSSVVDTSFPELAFVDKDDNQWKLSDLKVDRFTLPEDGAIAQAKLSGYSILKLDLPKNVSLESVVSHPKALMDLILQGVSMERSLGGGSKYRILSFGEPVNVSEYKDTLGRTWIQARWTVEFEDRSLIAYILPLPDGPAVLWSYQPTSTASIYEWDTKAICDRMQVAYRGDFSEWTSFLAVKKWVPDFLSDLRFQWSEADKRVSVASSNISLTAGPDVFDWTSSSTLFLSPAHYRQDGKLEYGIRTIVAQRDVRGRDFAILFKNIKPDSKLGAKAAEAWDALVKARAPFDGKPGISSKDNEGSIGAILPQPVPSKEAIYTLYLSMEEPGSEETLLARFTALSGGIQIGR